MIFAALLAGLFAGIAGAMGLGGGSVLIIYLTVFLPTEQLEAQGINLIFFLPIGLAAVLIYLKRGHIRTKLVLTIAAGGVVGAVAGLFLTGWLGGHLTAKIFGGLLVLLGLKDLFATKKKE